MVDALKKSFALLVNMNFMESAMNVLNSCIVPLVLTVQVVSLVKKGSSSTPMVYAITTVQSCLEVVVTNVYQRNVWTVGMKSVVKRRNIIGMLQ